VTLVVANFGFRLGRTLARRACFSEWAEAMHSPVLFFGAIDPKHQVPRNNVIFVGRAGADWSFFLTTPGIELLKFRRVDRFLWV